MFRSFPVVLLGSLLMLSGLLAVGEEPNAAVKPECPVGGGAIDKSVSADYQGKKVYFCCAKCVKKFEDDTAKYAVKANLQLVATGQFKQTACPISGKACKASFTSEVGGVQVAYCCGHCQAKVTGAEANEQLALVFGKKFDKAFQATAILCGGCGQIKGSDACCAADAAKCSKCGLAKGSPGCCKIDTASKAPTTGSGTK